MGIGDLIVITTENVATWQKDLEDLCHDAPEIKTMLREKKDEEGKEILDLCIVLNAGKYTVVLTEPEDCDLLAATLNLKLARFDLAQHWDKFRWTLLDADRPEIKSSIPPAPKKTAREPSWFERLKNKLRAA